MNVCKTCGKEARYQGANNHYCLEHIEKIILDYFKRRKENE